MKIKKAGILYHPMVKTTYDKAQELAGYLNSYGIESWTCSAWEKNDALDRLDKTDLILTTGGDGTILRAAQIACDSETPITGINMGTLGFMTELKAKEALSHLPELLSGKGWIDERSMLQAELVAPGQETKRPGMFYALNDVVVTRGAIARLIKVNACIDNVPLTTYRADGVILATATGSTGYSLAAGGPILYPQSRDWLLVPAVSHLGLNYSLLLASSSKVSLQLATTNQATLSIDGHINIAIADGTVINVSPGAKKTRFLRIHPQSSFYDTLEEKLRKKK
jgi:NAD+ kinase